MKAAQLEPEIKRLRALRWQDMSEKDDDNHDPLETRVGVSTTGDVDLLRLEAEMAAGDDYEIGNPHIPINTDKLEQAKQQIEQDGHTPAWLA
jgi:hypothetical protein